VVDWRSSVIAEGQRLGKAKNIQHVDWAAFADAWRAGYGPSMNRVRRGELPWTKLDVLHRMTLDELLVKFKIDGLSEAEKADLNRVWHRLNPWPDSVEGLTRLKSRFVIAPLSNGNLSLLTEMASTPSCRGTASCRAISCVTTNRTRRLTSWPATSSTGSPAT
jgi:2-haloacid dehalogenase